MAVAHNAIVSDDTRFRLTPDHYLKSRAEMAKLFADLPEALENTVEIARRCSFVLKTRNRSCRASPAPPTIRRKPNAPRRRSCAASPWKGSKSASRRSA
jgi:DNA polymerase-3 subunit alpha